MVAARFTGEGFNFHWFQASDLSLGALVEAVPDLVRDRFVAVSSFDSSPLRLTPEDLASGWRQSDSLAVSPKSSSPCSLPLGEWDEWFVFKDFKSMRSPEVFVNYGGFSLCPEPGNDWQQVTVERFWRQIVDWGPESYLAEGDNLICVTRGQTVIPSLFRFFGVGEQQTRTKR
jgi:hypothetical protein